MEQALESFLTCLHEQRFYDAHEVLEAHWFPRRREDSDEVRLIKGFINASVSFELMKRGRPDASGRAWKTYLKYRSAIDAIENDMLPFYRRVANQLERIHAAASVTIL